MFPRSSLGAGEEIVARDGAPHPEGGRGRPSHHHPPKGPEGPPEGGREGGTGLGTVARVSRARASDDDDAVLDPTTTTFMICVYTTPIASSASSGAHASIWSAP